MARTTAQVDGATLVLSDRDAGPITLDTPEWFAWLEQATTFAFTGPAGRFTARKEQQARGGGYWKAYRTDHGTLHRTYLGKAQDLTLDRLNRAAATLEAAIASAAPPPAAPAPAADPIAATAPPSDLLATKLFTPPARANLVARPRLFARLEIGLRERLTLVAAPAGFGKTTLLAQALAEWRMKNEELRKPDGDSPSLFSIHHSQFRAAWVSLDSADNDLLRFWSYVITALDTLLPGSGTTSLVLLRSPQPPPIERILTGVLNALAAAAPSVGDVALVLDDYHVITTPAIHAGLATLLEYAPPQLHLVLLTRADPALPLPRLRARGSVTELRAHDLRFTPDEAAAFLNQVMALALSAADLAALEARTEGWIAGLQLAALAMRDHQDRNSFIRNFRGSNRYIVEYLAAEVLASQPAHLQTFLLHTAVLDRMCGPLCDAVLLGGAEGGQPQAHPGGEVGSGESYSQIVLEQLERANLFVVPLDDERRWYRYHHLFADVLRHRLAGAVSSATAASLHRRASLWYEHQGLVAEAVKHAQRAADGARVAALIEQHGLQIIVGGQVQTVLSWLSALPDALVRARPLLCTVHALALLFTNQPAAAEARLQDSEGWIRPDTPADQIQLIQGRTAAIRANIARYTGDLAGCVALAQRVLELLPESETIARTIAALHLARAFRVSGDVRAEAERRASAVIGPFRAAQNLLGTLGAITNLARLQVLRGRLHAAAATYREMAQIAAAPDEPLLLEGPAYYAGMGALLYEWNDLGVAERHLTQAMEQLEGRLVVDAEDVALAYLILARLQQARGEHSTAQRTLETYTDLARQRGFAAHLVARGAAAQAQLALAQGDRAAAIKWADASSLSAADGLSFAREAEHLTLARVWIAQAGARLAQALELLDRLLGDAEAMARVGSVVEILIVRALAQWAQGTRDDALAALERALALAAPEGLIRRFVDAGAVMATMLEAQRATRSAQNDPLQLYCDALLAAFPRQHDANASGAQPALRSALERSNAIPEPLSAREIEVLRLIANGKSNADVARTLVIAVSTVKTHTNSIFAKLRVTSRTQAIALAHELRLL